jgi:Fic family protein
VKLALIHYQFEAIHPFLDGNGRIGRLLIPLMLCEKGVLPQPLLYLSAYFERNRNSYMDLLLEVSRSGAWIDWTRFFLRGVAEQSQDAIRRSRRLIGLQETYKAGIHAARASALLVRLVDQLFATPFITAVQVRQRFHVTHATAQANIQKLVSAGILKLHGGRRRNRIYYAPEILEVVSQEEVPESDPQVNVAPRAS